VLAPLPPEHSLFTVMDRGKLYVSRIRPVIDGNAETEVLGRVVEIRLLPHRVVVDRQHNVTETRDSTVTDQVPGLSGPITVATVIAVVAALEAILVGVWLTPWVSVPVGAVIAGYAFIRYLREESDLAEAWCRNHHILTHYADKHTFEQAVSAVRAVVTSWPRIGQLIQLTDPSPVLADSLWELSGALTNRARLRGHQQDLQQSQLGLPADVRVRQEVADRITRVTDRLHEVNIDVARRIQALQAMASECQRFVQEQQAIAHAREAVRGADRLLGRGDVPHLNAATATAAGEDLGARTHSVLVAFRELTRDTGVDEAPPA
jgi:hypothetical protein